MSKIINKEFYKKVYIDFDKTRQQPWAGWEKVIQYIDKGNCKTILDLGCGNCRFYDFVKKSLSLNIEYTGVDQSSELLAIAKKKHPEIKLIDTNIESLNFSKYSLAKNTYDLVVCFGVFHHFTELIQRKNVIDTIQNATAPDGICVISLWQFDIAKNVNAEATALGIKLGEDDHLLGWSNMPNTYRICHQYTQIEIEQLLSEFKQSGLILIDKFYRDGKNNQSNLYLILQSKIA